MIEMPEFQYEEWYLQSIRDILVDARLKNKRKIMDAYEKKSQELDTLLSEIVCDKDFSIKGDQYTLFEKLVLAPFDDLKRIHETISGQENIFLDIIIDSEGKEKKIIKDKWKSIYYLYDKFIKKGINTQLIQKYGIKCCPYCNENYIINRKKKNGKKYAMAQLDHFYPRDRFPIFSVSLYNLVPVCGTCNHIKSVNEIGICPHDHTFDFSHLKISYEPKSSDWINNAEEISISFEYDDKDERFKNGMEQNLETMGIISSYSTHTDYVQEILKKAQIYGKETRSNLLNDFPELFESDEELIKIIFSNYIEAQDLLKRPLSKLTCDLLTELKILT